jgi:Skp family chaperone for outer membrane proteins
MKMNQLKNLGLVLLGALLVYTTACGDKNKKVNTTTEPVVVEAKESTMKVGYYNVDSLNEQYKLVQDVSDEIESKIKKLSASFEAEVKQFEKWAKEMSDKMDKGLLMSREEKEFMEKYQKRQMELAQKEQKLSGEIQQLQADHFVKATNRVNDFVARYAKENGFDMIFQYQIGGQLTYINEAFNVTTDIINGLNEEYEQLKKDLK